MGLGGDDRLLVCVRGEPGADPAQPALEPVLVCVRRRVTGASLLAASVDAQIAHLRLVRRRSVREIRADIRRSYLVTADDEDGDLLDVVGEVGLVVDGMTRGRVEVWVNGSRVGADAVIEITPDSAVVLRVTPPHVPSAEE